MDSSAQNDIIVALECRQRKRSATNRELFRFLWKAASSQLTSPSTIASFYISFLRMTSIRYRSTRGEQKNLGFEDVVMAGLADDKGLFVPESIPKFSLAEIEQVVLRPKNSTRLETDMPALHAFV